MANYESIQLMLSENDVEGLKNALIEEDTPLESFREIMEVLSQISLEGSIRAILDAREYWRKKKLGKFLQVPILYVMQEVFEVFIENGHQSIQFIADLYWKEGITKMMKKDIIEILQYLQWEMGPSSNLIVP